MKRQFTLLLSFLLIAVLSSQTVHAQFLDSPFMESIGEFLGNDISWPPWGPAQGDTTTTIGQMLFVYIALFAILYASAKLIPVFKNSPNSGALMWFTFAIAGIAVTSTTFVADVVNVLGFGTDILSLGGFLVVVLLIIVFARWFGGTAGGQIGSGIGSLGRNIPGVSQVGEAARDRAEEAGDALAGKIGSKAERDEATELKELQKLEGLEKRELDDAKKITGDINTIIKILKSGNVSKDNLEQIRTTIGHMQPSVADIRKVQQNMRVLVSELDGIETKEMNEIRALWKQGVKNAGGTPRAKSKKREQFDTMAKAHETVALGIIQKKLAETRTTLAQYVNRLGTIETSLVGAFNDAMRFLSEGRPQSTIAKLEEVKGLLGEVVSIVEMTESQVIQKLEKQTRGGLTELRDVEKIKENIGKGYV